MILTERQLEPVCHDPARWVGPINATLERFAIDDRDEVVAFLATCGYESSAFQRLRENLNYNSGELLRMWPSRFSPDEAREYERRPEQIANRAYANRNGNGDERSGDGWRYRGRGPFQVTFLNNYAACGAALGLPLVDEPDMLATDLDAAAASCGWFWTANGCGPVAREGDFAGVSGIVNRGDRRKAADGMDKRWQWFRLAQSALARA